jgi:hypothetical protein
MMCFVGVHYFAHGSENLGLTYEQTKFSVGDGRGTFLTDVKFVLKVRTARYRSGLICLSSGWPLLTRADPSLRTF